MVIGDVTTKYSQDYSVIALGLPVHLGILRPGKIILYAQNLTKSLEELGCELVAVVGQHRGGDAISLYPVFRKRDRCSQSFYASDRYGLSKLS